jgi:alpha-mannosidase
VTLLRAVGWLSRMDLHSRPNHAGPGMPTPGAQCLRATEAAIWLHAGVDPRAARDAELGLRAFAAGVEPLWPQGQPLVEIEPPELLLTALKPAEEGGGVVLRVLNPTDGTIEGVVRIALPIASARSIRLDESPAPDEVTVGDASLLLRVPPRSLRSVVVEGPTPFRSGPS